MISETRRAFLRRLGLTAAGVAAGACEQILEDTKNLEEIKTVRKAQREAMEIIKKAVATSQEKERDVVKEALKKERFIPLPKIDGANIEGHVESAQYGGLAITLPQLPGKFIFPSLVEGEIFGLSDDMASGIQRISVRIDDLVVWKFEAKAKSLVKTGFGKIVLGQPLFEFDLGASNENLHKITGYIRGILVFSYPYDGGHGDIRQSDVTRENVLLDLRNAGKFQAISALRFAA